MKTMMANRDKRMLCRACGCKDRAEAFGLYVACPRCGSAEVVLAEIWEAYAAGREAPGRGDRSPAETHG